MRPSSSAHPARVLLPILAAWTCRSRLHRRPPACRSMRDESARDSRDGPSPTVTHEPPFRRAVSRPIGSRDSFLVVALYPPIPRCDFAKRLEAHRTWPPCTCLRCRPPAADSGRPAVPTRTRPRRRRDRSATSPIDPRRRCSDGAQNLAITLIVIAETRKVISTRCP